MEFTRNTSVSKSKKTLMFLIKIILIFGVILGTVMLLNKIEFPSPSKEIEKTISNEKLKIVK